MRREAALAAEQHLQHRHRVDVLGRDGRRLESDVDVRQWRCCDAAR